MASESRPDRTTELRIKEPAGIGSDWPQAPPSSPRRPWGRADRKCLLIWFGIAFVAPVPVLLALHIPLKMRGSVLTVRDELPTKAIAAFAVLLATWIVARMEKRPLANYGAPPRLAFGARFWEGSLWGFAALSATLLPLHLAGHFRIDSVALTGAATLRYAISWVLVFLAVAIHEEFAFRGYFLFALSRRVRFWRAAVILSCIFGVAHLGNVGENLIGILQVVLIGLVFCLTIRRTGTLWFAVGFHAAWDWAETFFYGTPDSGLLGVGRFLNSSLQGPSWLSGGSAGPEGSVIAILVNLVVALLIHFRFPNAVYPDRPV